MAVKMTYAVLVLAFCVGYVVGAWRQRQYIRKEFANSRWDWLK